MDGGGVGKETFFNIALAKFIFSRRNREQLVWWTFEVTSRFKLFIFLSDNRLALAPLLFAIPSDSGKQNFWRSDTFEMFIYFEGFNLSSSSFNEIWCKHFVSKLFFCR